MFRTTGKRTMNRQPTPPDAYQYRREDWLRVNEITPVERANYAEWKRNNQGSKWAWHKGKAFYDAERMRQKLRPDSGMTLLPPSDELAKWIAKHCPDVSLVLDKQGFVKDSWHCGRFHGSFTTEAQRADGAERVTAEYELKRVEGAYPWQVTFADGARFDFRTLAIAEAGITELLRRRKEKHPKPDTVAKRAASQIFFTAKRQQELPEDCYAEPAKPKRKRAPRVAKCRRELAVA